MTFDVAVVGSGPAGAIASYNLARAGLSVVVLEKEKLPRYKTCGGGLVFRARNLIPNFTSDLAEKEFFNVNWCLCANDLSFEVARPFPIITMVMRSQLDQHILSCAQEQGATTVEQTRFLQFSQNGRVNLETTSGMFEARFVIGADGALSKVARSAGFNDERYLIPALEAEVKLTDLEYEKHARKVRFDVDAIANGYGWVFPKSSHISIGIASEKRGKVNLKDAYNHYLNQLGVPQTAIQKEEIHGFQIPIKPRKKYAQNRVLLTGDAAGFADPLVAEGISHALVSGTLAAQSIIEGNLEPVKVVRLYETKIGSQLTPQIRTGKILSRLFYNYPTLRKSVLNRKGQRLTEYFTDVFSGTRQYPESFRDISKAILKAVV